MKSKDTLHVETARRTSPLKYSRQPLPLPILALFMRFEGERAHIRDGSKALKR